MITGIKKIINELGAINASTYFVHRALGAINRRCSFNGYYLVTQPVNDKALLPPRRGAKIDIKRIEKDDPLVTEFTRPKTEIEARYNRNAVCFAALKAGHMVGFIWIIPGPYSETEDRCVMVPDPAGSTAWDCDVFVSPEERLGFTFPKLWDAANEWLRNNSYNWVASRISAYNPNSVASHKRLGACVVGRAYFLNIGTPQLLLCSVAPYIHLSLRKKSLPTILVAPPS